MTNRERFRKLTAGLKIPVMAAPMFLVSGPELLLSACRAGVIGAMPAANARSVEILDRWLAEISETLNRESVTIPWILNTIVHRTYDRFEGELELVKKYQPPIVTTALGSPKRVIPTVHEYGGMVFASVPTPTFAKKAIEAGVDGLILLTKGAGGHTGYYHPFPLIAEIREFWEGPLILAGAISRGEDIHAAEILGVDLVSIGTQFVVAKESMASDAYREMLIESCLEDIVETDRVSGVLANWMRASLEAAGLETQAEKGLKKEVDFSGDIAADKKAWRDIWSAGEGVGLIKQKESTAEIVARLSQAYEASLARERMRGAL